MLTSNYRKLALKIGKNYLETRQHSVDSLWSAIPASSMNFCHDLVYISLPAWASRIGVGQENHLLVPRCCVTHPDNQWTQIDWWRAIFILSTCQFEWSFEKENQPIHSYHFKLPKNFAPLYQHAWVNRIFLFLRVWASHEMNIPETELFSEVPKAKVTLTHDIDYINKTLALRIKQSVMSLFNSLRCLLQANVRESIRQLKRLAVFLLHPADYWQFNTVQNLEARYGVVSQWNFYGGKASRRSFKEWLLDPGYDVFNKKLMAKFQELQATGHEIGLHQGFNSWYCHEDMQKEKDRLVAASGLKIESCRQHWLRFSLKDTWLSQEKAGFKLDTTLGFNDKPGFRNSAALRMPVWIASEERFSESLEHLPMVLMDSHLHDYQQLNTEQRQTLIDSIIEEIALVGGEATIIWHQRVFHPDYDWGKDYHYILKKINALGVN